MPHKSSSRETRESSGREGLSRQGGGGLQGGGHGEKRIRITTTIFSVVLCAVAGYVALQQPGGKIVSLSYDLPFLAHRAGGAGDLRAVFLDEMSGDVLDRSLQAPLLDKLREAGARAVVYDIIFDREWPDPEVDEEFSAAIRRFRGVDADGQSIPGKPRGLVMLACGRKKLEHTGFMGEQLIPPTDKILAAAGDEFGLVTLAHVDYVVRELVTGTPDEASISWKAAVALGANLDESKRLEQRWINYAGPPPHPGNPDSVPAIASIPARAVLSDSNPAMFRDKVVIIGGKSGIVSPKLGEDLFSTPFHCLDFRGKLPYMSGVEIQANMLANLLQGNWLVRSSRSFDLALIFAVALLAGASFARMRPFPAIYVCLLGILALAILGVVAIHFGRVWFPWSVVALVQLPVGLVGGTAANFYIERFFRVRITEEQEQLRDAFRRYLSPQMLDRITSENFHLKLGGDKVQATMLFTDLENFTDMCQAVGDPDLIVENLNGYFERTTGHIFDHDGVVIKFIGDAIFAAWGVPFADEEAALKSVRAAWNLFEHAKFVIGGDELRTRVGLHCGEVVAGNIGSSRHIDYTLIGDDVNLAARLEGMNKMLGTSILLSEEVNAHLAGEFRTRRVGRFQVKGRRQVTTAYELLGPASQTAMPEWVETYYAALTAFEEGEYEKAREIFVETCEERIAGDGPSRFFIDFLDRGENGVDGVVELKEK